jgi:hypothetical protein
MMRHFSKVFEWGGVDGMIENIVCKTYRSENDFYHE